MPPASTTPRRLGLPEQEQQDAQSCTDERGGHAPLEEDQEGDEEHGRAGRIK